MSDLLAEDDRGFLYGDALFETIRVERGVVHFAEQHIDRFVRAAKALLFSDAQIQDAVQVIRSLDATEDRLCRVTVSRHPTLGDTFGGSGAVHIRNRELPRSQRPSVCSARGFYNPSAYWHEFKTNNYLRNIEAQRFAKSEGADDAIMMTFSGRVGEASTSNIFIVVDGTLVTPLPEGILRGIVRSRVCRLAQDLGMPLEERIMTEYDLARCSELWLTSTGKGICAAASIDSRQLDDSRAKEFAPKVFELS